MKRDIRTLFMFAEAVRSSKKSDRKCIRKTRRVESELGQKGEKDQNEGIDRNHDTD
jgi:hypothetical protein